MSKIHKYIENITKEFNTWLAREHSYRTALKELLESINEDILATNEPARVSCWAPDFIITDKKKIPRGYSLGVLYLMISTSSKWLKDRKERNLIYKDILHYSKIILSLKETIRIMEEIDGVFKV